MCKFYNIIFEHIYFFLNIFSKRLNLLIFFFAVPLQDVT